MSDNNFTPGKKQKQISPAGDNYIFYAEQQPCAIANVIAKYGAVIFGESPNTEHRTQKKRTINALYSSLSQNMGLLFLGKTPDTGHRTREKYEQLDFNIMPVLIYITKVKHRQPGIFTYTKQTQANKRFLQEGGRVSNTKAVCHV